MVEKEPIVDRVDVELIDDFFAKRGIKHILYDIDGTLLDTDTQFRERIDAAIKFIAANGQEIEDEAFIHDNFFRTRMMQLYDDFDWANKMAFYYRSVTPGRWEFILEKFKKKYLYTESWVWDKAHNMLLSLYEEAPPLQPGAKKLIETTRRTYALQSAISHVYKPWNDVKLDLLGIRHLFKHMIVIRDDSFKDQGGWAMGMHQYEINPRQAFVFEDNVKSIWGAYNAGVRNFVWIDLDNGWSLYRDGKDNLPPGTIVVPQAVQFIKLLRTDRV